MKEHVLKSLPYVILFTLSIITLAWQNETVGFEPGHLGWVTSYTLETISHADFDSLLVRYAVREKDDMGVTS